jgi:DNA replication and repair protein RecF
MSVILKNLQLSQFRNHPYFSLPKPGRLIIIVGRNASGKTNIIEALQLLSMLESFRNPPWNNVVTKGEAQTTIEAVFLQNDRVLEIRMDVEKGRRSYSLNGKKKNRAELAGLIPAVIFIPDDLALVKDSPEVRRKLIDDIGQQLSPTYLNILNDYQKIVRQRTAVLKEQKENGFCSLILESWDESLLNLGALLFTHRIKLYKRLVDKAAELYQQFSKSEVLTSNYIPSFSRLGIFYNTEELVCLKKDEVRDLLKRTLELVRDEEWGRLKTLVGPHRDEIVFFIDSCDVRQFGSQGQQRSVALTLKLAQVALVEEISGNQPLLLLDDVMSELDEVRRSALIQAIDGQIQTIITTTDLSCFNDALLENAQIIRLKD